MKGAIIGLTVLLAVPAHASSLKCEFDEGVFHVWQEPTKITSDHFEMVFDSIDEKAGTARIIGNVAADDVLVIVTANHLTFMELTNSGNVNVTTVYGEGSRRKAVTSRHVGTVDRPMLSQMYGECRPY